MIMIRCAGFPVCTIIVDWNIVVFLDRQQCAE